MADYRPIKVKIWNDTWFLSLTDKEKVVWFYLLTNPYFHISGIYELPLSLISSLVGSLSETEKIIKKFETDNKIEYKDGFICIKNYIKNQSTQLKKKDNIYKSIVAYFSENSQLIELFNLDENYHQKDTTKPLCSPQPKEESSKEESNKEESKDLAAMGGEETALEIIPDLQTNKKKWNDFGVEAKEINSIFAIVGKINPHLNYGNTTQRKATAELIHVHGFEEMKKIAEIVVVLRGRPYAPTITTPCQLRDKYAQLKAFVEKESNKGGKIVIGSEF